MNATKMIKSALKNLTGDKTSYVVVTVGANKEFCVRLDRKNYGKFELVEKCDTLILDYEKKQGDYCVTFGGKGAEEVVEFFNPLSSMYNVKLREVKIRQPTSRELLRKMAHRRQVSRYMTTTF